jgi:hypothetical protein
MKFIDLYKLVKEQNLEMLTEMPVGNISPLSRILGDKELDELRPKDHRKRGADLQMMRSDEFADRLKNKVNLFKNNPFMFDIIFDDKNNFKFNEDILNKVKLHKDRITVIIRNVPNDFNSVLTPWIIGHRIGHALFMPFNPTAYKKGKNKIIEDYGIGTYRQIDELLDEYFTKIDPDYRKKREMLSSGAENYPDIYEKISNFKSAKQRRVAGMSEYINELVAEYLTKGQITFNVVPDKQTSSYYAEKIQERLDFLLNRLEGTIILAQ